MTRPWGVHAITDIYHPDVAAGLPDGRYVAAVCEPYTAGRLRAAWWVLLGRAYAFVWPKAGDLESVWRREPSSLRRKPHPFQPGTAIIGDEFINKSQRNARVRSRYDELMREGKHGHYETMFRVVREEVERAVKRADGPLKHEVTGGTE